MMPTESVRLLMRPNPEAAFSATENARADLCKAALQGVLTQYGCQLIGTPYIGADGRIMVDIHVLPNPGEGRNGNGQAQR